eukprot:2539920-Prymnesium_polylepis.1
MIVRLAAAATFPQRRAFPETPEPGLDPTPAFHLNPTHRVADTTCQQRETGPARTPSAPPSH